MWDVEKEFVQALHFALEGKLDNVAAIARRRLASILEKRSDLEASVKSVMTLISSGATRGTSISPLPVDADTRLELLRRNDVPEIGTLASWPVQVQKSLEEIVFERSSMSTLITAGLAPTRSVLLVGAPGVGKTVAAAWLAQKIGYPLLTLDLAAVMSSFLGKTGNNLRSVLDYARKAPSVLLLDEFDAIAKRRDDVADVGELKRLVNVLLQAVDDWPADGLLIAATNHPELLDPAAWRRFERVIEFPSPSVDDIASLLHVSLADEGTMQLSFEALAHAFHGMSYADVTRITNRAKRFALMQQISLGEALIEELRSASRNLNPQQRMRMANELQTLGLSQREISSISGIARDTLRKRKKQSPRSSSKAKKRKR